MSIKANISTKEIGKSYSKKLGKLGGEAFGNIIANKISKRFFLEDLDNPIESEDKNNNYNYSFRNEEIKNELLKKLFPSNLSSPEENINENDSKNKQNQKGKKEGKNIGVSEFGLFLKKVKGKNLINFKEEINKKRKLYIYNENEILKENVFYNICIEFGENSYDIIKKKFPQLYKNCDCFDFFKKLNKLFKQKNQETKIDFSQLSGYFINSFDFIDFDDEIILIIIFDGKPKSFENLKKELQKEKDQNDNFFEIFRKLKNYNLYILYYPDFEDEELFNLNINIKENDERIQNLEDIIQEMREKLGLKDESKENENKKIENEEEIEENGEKNE